jgi:hypothetical protein
MRAPENEIDPLLHPAQVAKLLAVSPSWLAKSRLNGTGPRFTSPTNRIAGETRGPPGRKPRPPRPTNRITEETDAATLSNHWIRDGQDARPWMCSQCCSHAPTR